MKDFKKASQLLSSVRKCAQNYGMIDDGDRIAVGVSGGKDSSALLCALALMRRFYPKKYQIVAVNVDMGIKGTDITPLAELCKELDTELVTVKTDIAEIVFERKSEGCSLCSRLRRGALHSEAQRLECTKVALGHTRDDVAVTLMLNLMYAGKIECFWPKNTPDGRDMTLIRPLIYTSEKNISAFCRANGIIPVENRCGLDGSTKRGEIKSVLDKAERENPGVYHRIFRAIEKKGIDGFIDFDGE